MGGSWSAEIKMIGVTFAGQMPYFALLIVALIGWLGHWRRGTPGMSFVGAGLLAEFVLAILGPIVGAIVSRAYFGTSPSGVQIDPYFFFLMQGLVFSLLNTIALGLILWGTFAIARERQEEETTEPSPGA